MAKIKVAVLMGGISGEREVSLISGREVASALKASGFDTVKIEVNADNRWIRQLEELRPDVAFIALHGKFGEDGTVQGLLELLGIPYVGSGVLASALAMDKQKTAVIYQEAGLKSPTIQHVISSDQSVSKNISYPAVVKPCAGGSSLGVTVCQDEKDVAAAVACAREQDSVVLIQDYIQGRELTCGVLDIAGDSKSLPVTEILPQKGKFYDYQSKYDVGGSSHIVPAKISSEWKKQVQDSALAAHLALGCRDLSRSDFITTASGEIYILETNTIPGMTPVSLFPEAARAEGIGFDQLAEGLIASALKRKS